MTGNCLFTKMKRVGQILSNPGIWHSIPITVFPLTGNPEIGFHVLIVCLLIFFQLPADIIPSFSKIPTDAKRDSIFADVNETESISGIECDSVSTDFIRFSWSSADINDKYELNINNSGTWLPNDSRIYDFSGLGFSEKYSWK